MRQSGRLFGAWQQAQVALDSGGGLLARDAMMQRSGKRTPKMEVRKLDANYCEFVLSDTDASVATRCGG